MKFSRKSIIVSAVIVVLLAIIAVTFVIFSDTAKKPRNLLKALQNSIDLKIKGFVYTEVGENNSKWEVKAETATYNKKQNLAILETVDIKLTTSDGKVFTMKADKGKMWTDKKNIEIKGNVIITSDDGNKFSTSHLNYSDAERKFYTDAPVKMESDKMKITGRGMTLYVDKGELNIPSMVKARIN